MFVSSAPAALDGRRQLCMPPSSAALVFSGARGICMWRRTSIMRRPIVLPLSKMNVPRACAKTEHCSSSKQASGMAETVASGDTHDGASGTRRAPEVMEQSEQLDEIDFAFLRTEGAVRAIALALSVVAAALVCWGVAPDAASATIDVIKGAGAHVTPDAHAQLSASGHHPILAFEEAQEQVKEILSLRSIDELSDFVAGMGWTGLLLYGLVYFVLELVAVPSLPLTVTCGYLFGPVKGFMVVSLASTSAAAAAFLISRYALRDLVSKWAAERENFRKIDRAIGREGFKIVLLLRLSPLLPFALSNYLYGLTSVKFLPYVFASQLGMVPGTLAFVIAGSAGKELTHNQNPFLLALAVLGTVGSLFVIGRVASEAVQDDFGDDAPELDGPPTDESDPDSLHTSSLPSTQHPPWRRQHQETER